MADKVKVKFKIYHNNPNIDNIQDFCFFHRLPFNEAPKDDNDFINNISRDDNYYYSIDDFWRENANYVYSQLSHKDKVKIKHFALLGISGENEQEITDNLAAAQESMGINSFEEFIFSKFYELTYIPCPCYIIISERYYEVIKYLSSSVSSYLDSNSAGNIDYSKYAEGLPLAIQNINYLRFLLSIIYERKQENPKFNVTGFFKSFSIGQNILDYDKIYNLNNWEVYRGADAEPIHFTGKEDIFIDISDFIISIQTNVDNGGNFTITLPYIGVNDIIYNIYGYIWDNDDKDEYNFILRPKLNNDTERFDFYNVDISSVFSRDYFNWLISNNDLLLISMDDNYGDNYFINRLMIGLVDSVSVYRSADGNNSVVVKGRDLMKLLSDDASFYFPLGVASSDSLRYEGEYSPGFVDFFNNKQGIAESGRNQYGDLSSIYGIGDMNSVRMPTTGNIRMFNEASLGFTIDYVVNTVMKTLSNIEIIPNTIIVSQRNIDR